MLDQLRHILHQGPRESYTGDTDPRGEEERRVGGRVEEVYDGGDGVGVESIDREEADQGGGWGVVEQPAGLVIRRLILKGWAASYQRDMRQSVKKKER